LDESPVQQAFSWTVISESKASKKVDRSVFLYRMTGIPIEVRSFFEIENLSPGSKRDISLYYHGKEFRASLLMGIQDIPRTRMVWKSDFARLFGGKFPNEYKLIKSGDSHTQVENIILLFDKTCSDIFNVSINYS